MIRKVGNKWVLYSKTKGKDGKRKVLGRHNSRAAAVNQERAINARKHGWSR